MNGRQRMLSKPLMTMKFKKITQFTTCPLINTDNRLRFQV